MNLTGSPLVDAILSVIIAACLLTELSLVTVVRAVVRYVRPAVEGPDEWSDLPQPSDVPHGYIEKGTL